MSRPKNILFISHYFYPHIGGVEKHIYEVSKKLLKHNCRVTVITEKYHQELLDVEYLEGIRILRFEFLKKRFLGLFDTWYKLYVNREYIREADIVHVHDVFIWYLPLRMLFFRKPIFATFHGWEGVYPIPFKNKFVRKLSVFLSKGNICVGEYIKKYYDISSDFISYGGVNAPNVTTPKIEKSIVFVGRLAKDVGLQTLLEVCDLLKTYNVEFCGDGDFRNECSKRGKVLGFVKPDKYLSKSLICFASGYLSILEGLANKCLVVAVFDNPLRRDYILLSPFKRWLIYGDNPGVISESIKNHLKESQLQRTIKESFAFAKSQTWQNVSDLYLQLWKNYNSLN